MTSRIVKQYKRAMRRYRAAMAGAYHDRLTKRVVAEARAAERRLQAGLKGAART